MELSFTKEEMPRYLDKARDCLKEGKNLTEAEAILNAILNQSPNASGILGFLSTLHVQKGHISLAEHLAKLALENEKNEKNKAAILNNLGVIYKQYRFDTDKAKPLFEQAVKINGDDPEHLINYASVFLAEGNPKKCLELMDKALKNNKENICGHWNRALALLEIGDYEQGFNEYHYGIDSKGRSKRNYIDLPRWDGTPDKKIIVYGEQGIGDEIMFASLLNELAEKSKMIIFDSHPRLCDIFRRSFPQMPVYGTRKCAQIQWINNHRDIDYQIEIGSLPKFLRKNEKDFEPWKKPYLLADPLLIEHYKRILDNYGNKPKIGISWRGGTPGTGAKHRKIPLELLLPIFDSIDADFISLQYTEGAKEQIDEFQKKYPHIKIIHDQEMINDYDYTAACVKNLDLVISVPQSVVHLAGALGVNTIQLAPKRSLWQAGVYGKNMPWYESVINVWQDDTEKWEFVINKVKEMICNLYPMNTAN